jgi:hypothetical protein
LGINQTQSWGSLNLADPRNGGGTGDAGSLYRSSLGGRRGEYQLIVVTSAQHALQSVMRG